MNITEYIDNLSPERQEGILKVRDLIKDALPDAKETMQYRMPTFSVEGELMCALASQKNYMAFYLMYHDLLLPFAEELKSYNCGKSCIRFKKVDDQLLDTLDKIIRYASEHKEESIFFGKTGS